MTALKKIQGVSSGVKSQQLVDALMNFGFEMIKMQKQEPTVIHSFGGTEVSPKTENKGMIFLLYTNEKEGYSIEIRVPVGESISLETVQKIEDRLGCSLCF